MSLIHHLHLGRLLIKTDGLKSCLGLLHRQRQTHIAKTDHTYDNFLFCDFVQKYLLHGLSLFNNVPSAQSVKICIYFPASNA